MPEQAEGQNVGEQTPNQNQGISPELRKFMEDNKENASQLMNFVRTSSNDTNQKIIDEYKKQLEDQQKANKELQKRLSAVEGDKVQHVIERQEGFEDTTVSQKNDLLKLRQELSQMQEQIAKNELTNAKIAMLSSVPVDALPMEMRHLVTGNSVDEIAKSINGLCEITQKLKGVPAQEVPVQVPPVQGFNPVFQPAIGALGSADGVPQGATQQQEVFTPENIRNLASAALQSGDKGQLQQFINTAQAAVQAELNKQ
jgi:vacuolar-type H+-ATPase subunit I/STV1